MTNPSFEQKLFIERQKRHYQIICFARIAFLIGFLILWEFSANVDWIDSFIFSCPSQILSCFMEMLENKIIFLHIGVTLYETLLSFFLVTICSTAIAVLLWLCHSLAEIFEPYLVILNSLPKSALAPLLIVWLGANKLTIIVAGMSVAIFGSILSLHTSFCNTDSEKLTLIYTLGGNKLQALTKIILPANIPTIISTMKINIGLCLVGVVIGEFIGGREGLGYLIIYGSQVFKLDWLLMSIVILCIIALGLYGSISLFEKWYANRV